MHDVEVQKERLTNKVESIGNDRRFFKWLDDFEKKIALFKNFKPEQKREALLGLITAIDVFMINPQTHWLEIQSHIPLIGEEPSVGRDVKHAGQTTLYMTPMHAAKDKLIALIGNIRAALSHVRGVAEQLPRADRWKTFLDYVVARITRPLPPWLPQNQLVAAG